jgi:hypothetical protein
MNLGLAVGYLIAGILLTLFAGSVLIPARRSGSALIVFGDAPGPNRRDQQLLITTYLAQQKVAFKMASVAVAAGVFLGVVLIGRLVVARVIDVTVLTSVVGVAGDIWLGAGAFKLYDRASKRLEDAVRGVPSSDDRAADGESRKAG